VKKLSKSKIIAFRQCPKRLWLEIHHPELREDSFGTEASYRIGNQVGEIAKRIYAKAGEGIEINAQRDGFDTTFEQSEVLLAAHEKVLFEAGLTTEGLLAFADVMIPDTTGGVPGWKMVEVKSSTKVKDYHHDDVAVQSHIARQSGVNLKSVSLAHIDNTWIYPGGGDYDGLLIEANLSAEAFARGDEVASWVTAAHEVAGQETEPPIETGDHCYQPFECGFCNYCNRDKIQPEFPLSCLPRLTGKQRTEFAANDITELCEVRDGDLTPQQLKVKTHTLAKTVYFDAAGARADLAGLGFPAYFLDFETAMTAVPIWAGTRPYEQITFQFSLHKWSEFGVLSHRGFLDLSGAEPSDNFARELVQACGKSGPIFVYNASFEKTCIKRLAERVPMQSTALTALLDRIVDLLPITRNRYYHPAQHGSWSIKAVLPAIAPDLSYDQLEGIADGATAMETFWEAIHPETTPGRKAEIQQQLEAYCRLDTLAMVRLCQFLLGKREDFAKTGST